MISNGSPTGSCTPWSPSLSCHAGRPSNGKNPSLSPAGANTICCGAVTQTTTEFLTSFLCLPAYVSGFLCGHTLSYSSAAGWCCPSSTARPTSTRLTSDATSRSGSTWAPATVRGRGRCCRWWALTHASPSSASSRRTGLAPWRRSSKLWVLVLLGLFTCVLFLNSDPFVSFFSFLMRRFYLCRLNRKRREPSFYLWWSGRQLTWRNKWEWLMCDSCN